MSKIKNAIRFTIGLALLALLVTPTTRAQRSLAGEWKAETKSEGNKLQLNLESRSDKGRRHQMGQSFEYSDFQGLTREQATNGGPVKFSLVREAGRIDCEGSFQNGQGSGTFQFTANSNFVSAMKSRGFDFEKASWSENGNRDSEDRLFAATTLNVTTALADDLVSSGFGNLEVEDLFKAAIFKIDSNFMREMKASGFQNLTMEDLVKARIFKIDAAFVTKAAQMGFDKEPFEGLTNLSVEDVVKLKIFNIDANYIRKAKAEGVSLDVEKLVQRKIGVGRNQE
jgi:hypothetical protein